ncbi:MAG: hypothetical protein HKN91_17510, partial [Acidimicrobiia bacterium]|nr:hypothetical protein [Acidimicrobiia bacterium]
MLRFYIGRIPVGIHFTFLFVLWIAYSYFNDLTQAALAGIGILIGIIIHELGHAITARRFGAEKVSITLFALGGVTTYPPPPGLTPGRRFLTAAAGSALAFAVGVPIFLVREPLLDNQTLEPIVVGFLIATLFWGVLNWVPIRPLDGGQMLTSALQIFFPKSGAMAAKVISIVFTAGAVYWLYSTGQEFAALY